MWTLDVTNIGGIRSGTTAIDDGLNVIQASNFRGKSSLVAALRTATGATGQYDEHPLTEGATEGEVSLKTEDEEYSVLLERQSQNVVKRTGTPYITDETDQLCARLFACLDEGNPIRKAVRNDDDLTELLQAPLNIEDIDAQISRLKQEKRDIEQRIAEAEDAGEQLPPVQEAVTTLEKELEELRARRTELAEEETNKEQIDELSDDISAKSGELTNLSSDISRLEDEIARKEQQIEQKNKKRDELEVPEESDKSIELAPKRERIDTLERQIELLEDLARANQNVIDEGDLSLITDVDRTIAGDDVDCWVCGQQTTTDEVRARIDHLQSKTVELRESKQETEAKIDEVERRRQEIQRTRRKKQQLEEDIQRLKTDVDEKKGLLEDKRGRKSDLEEEITTLREQLEDAEDEYNEELTDVKTEIRTTETKLENKREKLGELEQTYGELDELESERDDVQTELTELRNRKKDTQENLKERFNSIIADIIDEFQPGFSSARLVLKTDERGEVESIDLEIARDIDNRGQRTSVDTLSEGEVELIGLVVALAGYHAFDVDSIVPFILIDGISQLAAEHLRRVATYLEDMSDILVTTAYPEAGDFDGHIINPEEWEVVSDNQVTA